MNSELWIHRQAPIIHTRVVTHHTSTTISNSTTTTTVIFAIDKFALTSNNITYAILGEQYQYFDFFQCHNQQERTLYAKLPVWAVATVVKSSNPRIQTGRRVYGYFPAAKYATFQVQKDHVSNTGFKVIRNQLPANRLVYNQYYFLDVDAFYPGPQLESHMLIYRPLYFTSFFLDDFLTEHKYFGSKNVIVLSASSKTGFTSAFLFSKSGATTYGLTSTRNVEFVQDLDIYDHVLDYNNIQSLEALNDCVIVDMSGNRRILAALSSLLPGKINSTVLVGLAHPDGLDGPRLSGNLNRMNFFAPAWIKKRNQELGSEMHRRMLASWSMCMAHVQEWTRIESTIVWDAVLTTYSTIAEGKAHPSTGQVVVPHYPQSRL